MKKPTCKTCPYYEKRGTTCHKNMPCITADEGREYTSFPDVHDDEWCGEHPDFQKWIEQETK